jgi:plastocyanin
MATNSHAAVGRIVAAAMVALVLSACGGTSTNETTTTGATPAATPSAASASPAEGTNVAVIEKEFAITLSQTSFSPGTYTFTIQNQGSFPHDLIIEGPGVDKKKSAQMAGGESGSLTVDLQAGTYELWCGVDAHKAKGMALKITVV